MIRQCEDMCVLHNCSCSIVHRYEIPRCRKFSINQNEYRDVFDKFMTQSLLLALKLPAPLSFKHPINHGFSSKKEFYKISNDVFICWINAVTTMHTLPMSGCLGILSELV